MAVEMRTDPVSGELTATFTIAATAAVAVSVVGSFNDWTPGLHSLEPADDGTVSVTVRVSQGEDLYFRYLDSNGLWFDDPESDAITENGSVVFASRRVLEEQPPAESGGGGDAARSRRMSRLLQST
jgi:1,4-alpha-glucan branching enzyme